MYDEYGEVIMEDDGYYPSPHGPEVLSFLKCDFHNHYCHNKLGCVSIVVLTQ